MPSDLQSIADPRLILLAWAAGLALVAGTISLARIVGPGFIWLSGGIAGLVGLPGAIAGGAWWSRAGLLLAILGLVWARRRRIAGILLLLAGGGYLIEATLLAGYIPVTTATLALGGVSGEMLLGHWYLVDPRLPRSALRNLAIVGVGGLAAEAVLQFWLDMGLTGGAIGFWILLVSSIALMVAVVAALRYPAYSGVMAATGLSYLALLTTLGAVFVGRALAAGLGPFDL
ncbi:MAG TPA: hypothetical protein VMQ46_10015 [Acidimicrobiia bacterium]|nr:hypothetical protein [Acidimicrobiia bacterium]